MKGPALRLVCFLLLACIASSVLAVPEGLTSPQQLQNTDVFVSGRDGYHTYRIPALLTTKNGTLLAFCEGRKTGRSDSGDIDLLLKRSEDFGKTWSSQEIVWDDRENTCGNPCPVVDRRTGTIWLLMTWNRGDDREGEIKKNTSRDTRRVWVSRSNNDGLTWSKPVEITATAKRPEWRWYATGPGVGIQLQKGPWKGRMVIPCDHSVVSADDPDGYNSHVIISDDHGKTWYIGGVISPKVNECQVVELDNGTLMLNMRNYDRSKTTRAIAASTDGGITFSKVTHDPVLVEPICQASFLRYTLRSTHGRNRLLFSNPAHAQRGNRRDMTVRLSYDEGRSWPVSKVLYAGPSAYSCLTILPDGNIACLYEAGQKSPYEKIILTSFTLNWLTGKLGKNFQLEKEIEYNTAVKKNNKTHLMKGENHGNLEHCITHRRCCYSCRGICNEEIEIIKQAKHLQ